MAKEYLYINNRDELIRIDFSKIVYMEADGNYTHIIQINKQRASTCQNLGEMQKLLSEKFINNSCCFARVGKKFIINMDYIYRIEPLKKSLILSDGIHFAFQLGISKDSLRTLKDLIMEQLKTKQ